MLLNIKDMKFCKTEHFTIDTDGATKKMKLVSNGGFEIVLFYSEKCPHCYDYLKAFGNCNDKATNVTFTLVNVDDSRQLIELSKGTNTELQQVPYVVMFVNGDAFMSYSGPPEINDILEFCHDVSVYYIENTNDDNKNEPATATKTPSNSCAPGDDKCLFEGVKYRQDYCTLTDDYKDRTSS